MKKEAEKFLQQLLDAPSPSGIETPASNLFRKRVEKHADKVTRDVHGNTFAILNPTAKFKFMLAGHIDEIGLMITHIDKEGYCHTSQVGGMDPSLLVGQRVKILTDKGTVPAVIGRKAIHMMKPEERTKAVKMENVWLDLGAKDREDAEKVVSVGDYAIIDAQYQRLRGDLVTARGCDDKAGAFIVAEVIRALSKRKLNISVIGVATVQEEVGLRGAITSSYTVQPDAGIAIDVGFASDHPETDKKTMGEVNLGGGPNLHRGPNINPTLEKGLEAKAKALKIPFQLTASSRATGTDANAMQLSTGGTATALVSIPNRYMHTPVEMVSLSDLDNIIKLLTEYLAAHPAKRDYRP